MPTPKLSLLAPFLVLVSALALAQDPAGDPAIESTPEPTLPPAHFALVGATVHTMVEGEAPATRTVVIENGLISAVLDPEDAPPEGAKVIEVRGLHLVPGLIDGHVNHDVEQDVMYVARGVTLVRVAGGNYHDLLQQRMPSFRFMTQGPDLYIAGPALSGDLEATSASWPLENGRAAQVLPERLAELQARAVDTGLEAQAFDFDYLFYLPSVKVEAWSSLLTVAHEVLGLSVWGALPEGGTLTQAIDASQDGIIGLDPLLPPGQGWTKVDFEGVRPAVEALIKSDMAVTPLLATSSRQLAAGRNIDATLERMSPLYAQVWRDFAATVDGHSPEVRSLIESVVVLQRQALLALWKGGVHLVPGSGAPNPLIAPGDGLLDELDQWIAAGIPSAEVLRLATAGAADELGLTGTRGRIAPGQIADLVGLGTDPDGGSLAGFRDPELVVLRGRLLERWDLEDLNANLVQAQNKAREQQTRPLEIAPPDMPEGELLLLGQCETQTRGQRVVGERFAVVDLLDGRIAYGTRVIMPATLTRPEHQVHLVQTFKGDKLVSFDLLSEPIVAEGEEQDSLTWHVEGTLVGSSNRMSIRRSHTLSLYDTKVADRSVALVDFSDALTALIMGRHMKVGQLDGAPVFVYPLSFQGNTWEPMQDRWQTVVQSENHVVIAESRHSNTMVVAGLNAVGAPVAFQRILEGSTMDLQLQDFTSVTKTGAPPKPGRVFVPKKEE
jgi:hypothetical protein